MHVLLCLVIICFCRTKEMLQEEYKNQQTISVCAKKNCSFVGISVTVTDYTASK